MSDREKAQEFCNVWRHDWEEEHYGYRCRNCRDFIPCGCEPWMPLDDEFAPAAGRAMVFDWSDITEEPPA